MKIGDKVTWTHCSKRGRGYQFTTRTGKVLHIDGGNVAVTYKGKLFNLRPDRVRLAGQTTELTDMFLSKPETIPDPSPASAGGRGDPE